MFKVMLSNFHLEKIVWIIKSKLMYIVFAGLVLALLGGAYAGLMGGSVYRTSTSLYIYSNQDYVNETDVNIGSNDFTAAKSLLDSYMQIIKSSSFLTKVIDETGLTDYSVDGLRAEISTSAVSNTAIFTVYVMDEDPYNAVKIANAVASLAPNEVRDVVKAGGLQVVDEAQLPTSPYSSTSVFVCAVIGFLAGGILAALYFLFKGLNDTRIRRTYEVQDMFNIPILGTVPLMKDEAKKTSSDKSTNGEVEQTAEAEQKALLSEESPFIVKEAYNDIRTNLLFMGHSEKCPVFAVVSPDDEEGKTLNSYNISLSYSQMNKKVLLIDADFRKSNMCELLGLHAEKKEGLSEYLAGEGNAKELVTNVNGIDLIMAGSVSSNSAELLGNGRFKKLLEEKQKEYDVIIVDLPSAGIVADGFLMADMATAYVLVIREFQTQMERIEMVVRKLESVGANICGFVYNGISTKSPDYNYRDFADGKAYGKKTA